MAEKTKYQQIADKIVSGEIKPTINNTNEKALLAIYTPPPKKRKRKPPKSWDKRRVDSRLKIWKQPRAHSTQASYHKNRAKKRRAKAREEIFFLLFREIMKNL